jgi:hypothetical protein
MPDITLNASASGLTLIPSMHLGRGQPDTCSPLAPPTCAVHAVRARRAQCVRATRSACTPRALRAARTTRAHIVRMRQTRL